jgi:hypothetical protein
MRKSYEETGIFVGRFLDCWDIAGKFQHDDFTDLAQKIMDVNSHVQRVVFGASEGCIDTIERRLFAFNGGVVKEAHCPKVMFLDVTFSNEAFDIQIEDDIASKSLTLIQQVQEQEGGAEKTVKFFGAFNNRIVEWDVVFALLEERGFSEMLGRFIGESDIRWGIRVNKWFYLFDHPIYRVVTSSQPLVEGQDQYDLGRIERLLGIPMKKRDLNFNGEFVRSTIQEYALFNVLHGGR